MPKQVTESDLIKRQESGRRIRELRTILKLTQQELADLIIPRDDAQEGDGDRTRISKIEKGLLPIDDQIAEIFALYFNSKIREDPGKVAKVFPDQPPLTFVEAKTGEIRRIESLPYIDKEYLTCDINSYNKSIEENINWEKIEQRRKHSWEFQNSLFNVMRDFGYEIEVCSSFPSNYYLLPSHQDCFNLTPVPGFDAPEIILKKDGKAAQIPFPILHRTLLDIAQAADSKFCQLLSRYSLKDTGML